MEYKKLLTGLAGCIISATMSANASVAVAALAPANYSFDGHGAPGPGIYSTPGNYNTITLGAVPAPFIHVDLNIPGDPFGAIQGGGTASIGYYYHISGAPTATGLVATQIAATMSLGGTSISGGYALIDGSNIPEAGICWPLGECGLGPYPNNPYLFINSQFFSGVLNEMIPFDGQISLRVFASGGTSAPNRGTTFSGSLDPVITVPAGYTITFSPGIGNSAAVAAIPEPETYTMMLAGLGLLGYVARRRKQIAA